MHSERKIESDIVNHFFDGDHKNATRDVVKSKLMSLVGKTRLEDVADFAKLWVVFLFATILFSTAHYSIPVGRIYTLARSDDPMALKQLMCAYLLVKNAHVGFILIHVSLQS